MNLFSNTINSLGQALNYASLKQKVIAQNIANVDTPNYKAQDVSFKSFMQDQLGQDFQTYRTDQRHLDFSTSTDNQSSIITRQNVSYNNDGNSVDIDKEMSDMATNQIYDDSLVQQLNSKFSALQMVIKGGQ